MTEKPKLLKNSSRVQGFKGSRNSLFRWIAWTSVFLPFVFALSDLSFAEPARNASDYYKRLLSALQVEQYKYDQEIGQTAFTTLKEEEFYRKGLFKGVRITATIETQELLDAYVESQKFEDTTKDESEALKEELYAEYRIQDRLCFLLHVDNTSNLHEHLQLDAVKENVILQLKGGKEYKPVDYDKELEGMLPRRVSGLVCYPKHDAKGVPLVPIKTKWLKLKIVRIIPMDSKFAFRGPVDFEFLFDYGKFAKYLEEGFVKPEGSVTGTPPEVNTVTPGAQPDSVQLGLSAVKEGNLDKAISYFKVALEASPDDVSLYVLLGSVYMKKNLYDAAVSMYKHAVELAPVSPLAHFHLGIAYREKKDYEKAVVEFKQAVGAQEDYTEAYFKLGETYADLKDAENAKKAFEKALEIDPSHERARRALEKLKN